MFNRFRHHVPPSDPVIPPCDACLTCGKKQDDEDGNTTLMRCSACKMARFCDRSCQKAAWTKAGHKSACAELKARNQPDMLPYQVRVIRNAQGAWIENGKDIPKAKPPTTTQEKQEIPDCLSECARDHYHSVVKHLTTEQREQLYPLACIERWGGPPERHVDEYEDCEPGTVSLSTLLNEEKYEGCSACGADGTQFFSFCLNRPVNSNMVHHCEFCKKCFYFQPGCLRGCQHCGMGMYWDSDGDPATLAGLAGISVQEAQKMLDESYSSELVIKYAKDARGCSVPRNASSFSRGMAMEGFWGW